MSGKTKKKITKPLRVFEAFAGIGAQHSALKRANVNFEVVGISEWFINALLTYDAIHNNEEENIEITTSDNLLVLQVCHYNPPGTYLLVICKEKK